ncbi:MAG TPA: Ni/Fe hydrogenase subunit alpha [Coriobacteriia bacterium]
MAKLTIEHVARIEGHGNITVDVADGVVRDIRMDIVEPARFFESMVVGRRFDDAPLITSRICGICSPNHVLTSIKALEVALGVEVSDRTALLRKLLVYGSYLQNHATHLYILAAPDYVGLPNVFPLADSHPEIVERALRLKKLGNDLTTLVGGRPVHPVTAVIGGFTSEPTAAALEGYRDLLLGVAHDALATVELFASFPVPDFATSGEMLALTADDDYAIYDGDTTALDAGWRRSCGEYREFIGETVVGHSNAKHSTVGGRPFLVGSVARANINAGKLNDAGRAALAKAGLTLPTRNPFHMNVLQAVELADASARCAGYIERLLDMGGSSIPEAFRIRAGEGGSATEAPRGTLYHSYAVDDDGIVTRGDVITPTAQNLANIEADMRAFAPTIADRSTEEFTLLVEELVRSYDPCLSCAVH